MANVSVEIKGIEATTAKMVQVVNDLQGTPFVDAMKRATMIVLRAARINVPVDTGRLRASIAPEVRFAAGNVVGIVGTPVEYSAKVEEPGPVRRSGRRPYLEPALTENEAAIVKEIGDFVGKVVNK